MAVRDDLDGTPFKDVTNGLRPNFRLRFGQHA
jgi:hypothetical protein